MKRLRYLIVFVFLNLLVGCGGNDQPLPKVKVIEVKPQDVSDVQAYIATIRPVNEIELIPRVAGFLNEQLFEGGDDVVINQKLYQIEPNEYIAAVKEKEAALARAEATLTNNRLNYERIKDLNSKGFAAQSELDKAEADFKASQADVKAAEADLYNANLNLSYTEIFSPINGRVSISPFSVGDYVTTQSGALATIVQLDPIYATFSLDETALLAVKLSDPTASQAELNAMFTPVIEFQDGTTYPHEGRIHSMNNQINSGTGAILVRTIFENPHAVLVPGQFVNLKIRKGEPRMALTVPAGAVIYDKQGYFVLRVNKDHEVERVYIEEGVKNNKFVEVKKGLQDGDLVIIDGIQKAIPGEKVDDRKD